MNIENEISKIFKENISRLTNAMIMDVFDEVANLIQREILRSTEITFQQSQESISNAKIKMLELLESR